MPHYRVIIEDEAQAKTPLHAVKQTVERIQTEETMAFVENLDTGEIYYYEIKTGERLNEGDKQ
tara:strand:+ start:1490 stop:1678 length:189 start_codon:yes stop_codon:yes gene_type:complete